MSERVGGAATLQGLRVVEVAQNLAGPYCGRILAGLGADVVKVEPPEGDAARRWGPPFADGEGTLFMVANPGKRSISLDLRRPGGLEVMRRLVRGADVLIEALRPGAFSAMGFGWDDARSLNPRLIYASVLAYGERGPLADLAGYEPLMQAQAGLMSYTGEAEGPAVRVGTSVVDLGTGMWTAIAVLAALRERDRTGVGTRISASLFDTALAWSGYHLIGHAANGTVAGRHGTELPMICPYGSFPAADGAVMIAVGNDALFGRLCVALGLEEARADARFATNPERVAHRAALNALMGARTAERTVERLLADLREAGVPCAPIQDIAQVAVDPQTGASEMLHPPEGGEGVPNVAIPLRWDGLRGEASHAPPAAGADTEAVLRELDYTADEIDELRRSSTV